MCFTPPVPPVAEYNSIYSTHNYVAPIYTLLLPIIFNVPLLLFFPKHVLDKRLFKKKLNQLLLDLNCLKGIFLVTFINYFWFNIQ